jgi:hypothetical protein
MVIDIRSRLEGPDISSSLVVFAVTGTRSQQEKFMGAAKYDKVQKQLIEAIKNDAPCTFDEPVPVLITLDNGVKYKGVVVEAQPESDDFPNGMVMVRTANSDIGVPVSYISGR